MTQIIEKTHQVYWNIYCKVESRALDYLTLRWDSLDSNNGSAKYSIYPANYSSFVYLHSRISLTERNARSLEIFTVNLELTRGERNLVKPYPLHLSPEYFSFVNNHIKIIVIRIMYTVISNILPACVVCRKIIDMCIIVTYTYMAHYIELRSCYL